MYWLFQAGEDSGEDVEVVLIWEGTKGKQGDDNSNDGKFTSYLKKEDMRRYDSELFDILKQMVGEGKRNVVSFSEGDTIPNALYYDAILTDDKTQRAAWHESALKACKVEAI